MLRCFLASKNLPDRLFLSLIIKCHVQQGSQKTMAFHQLLAHGFESWPDGQSRHFNAAAYGLKTPINKRWIKGGRPFLASSFRLTLRYMQTGRACLSKRGKNTADSGVIARLVPEACLGGWSTYFLEASISGLQRFVM